MTTTLYADFATVAAAESGLPVERFTEALAATLKPGGEATPEQRCERVWSECPATVRVRAAAIVGRARTA